MTHKLTAFLVLGQAGLLLISCSPNQAGPPPGTASAKTSAPAEVEVTRVVSQKLNTTVRLPAQLTPYEVVDVYPKVTGFVKWIKVDRGSRVKMGQQIALLEAPELVAQRAEAESKFESAESQLAAAQAKLAADQATYQRMSAAAKTPGVVAANDLEVAQKTAQSDEAIVLAAQKTAQAAQAALRSIGQLEDYLNITAALMDRSPPVMFTRARWLVHKVDPAP